MSQINTFSWNHHVSKQYSYNHIVEAVYLDICVLYCLRTNTAQN